MCVCAFLLNFSQERERKERERVVRAKVAACAFARGYLGGIVNNVFQQLQDTGYFYDPVEREVRRSNCCWCWDGWRVGVRVCFPEQWWRDDVNMQAGVC